MDRRILLQHIANAMCEAAEAGSNVEHGDGWGNASGRILEITENKVTVEISGMGSYSQVVTFELPPD